MLLHCSLAGSCAVQYSMALGARTVLAERALMLHHIVYDLGQSAFATVLAPVHMAQCKLQLQYWLTPPQTASALRTLLVTFGHANKLCSLHYNALLGTTHWRDTP